MCHAADLIEKHDCKNGSFYTTVLFWECECEEEFIHPVTQEACFACNTHREDAPDARVDEVFQNAYTFHLPPVLINAVTEAAYVVDPSLAEGVPIPF